MDVLIPASIAVAFAYAVGSWVGRRRSHSLPPSSRRPATIDEGALKRLFEFHERGRTASVESLAGSLGPPLGWIQSVVGRLEGSGYLRTKGGDLDLTDAGARRAAHVARAHRLWERYLVGETRWPVADVCRSAEAAEHGLTDEALDALVDGLGHPRLDPHGEPIPPGRGSLAPADCHRGRTGAGRQLLPHRAAPAGRQTGGHRPASAIEVLPERSGHRRPELDLVCRTAGPCPAGRRAGAWWRFKRGDIRVGGEGGWQIAMSWRRVAPRTG